MLVALAAVVYFQQRSLTVAAAQIMPELSLSQMQIGWLQWAFVLSYGMLQFPGGVVAQRLGARVALTVTGILAVLATAAVPLAPGLVSGGALFAILLATQLLLGIAQAPFFPVCAGVMESWLPARRWAFAQGLHTFGCQVGAAIAPPIIVVLMTAFGWRPALFWSALPALGLVALWAWYGRNSPHEHSSVSAAELAELDEAGIPPADSSISLRRIVRILVNRDIALVTFSYVCLNFLFYLLANWSFLYLVQERHFTVLEGGWLASLPPLGAAIGAGVGGGLTDVLCTRFGVRWGYRILPMLMMPVAGLLLLAAIYSVNPYVAAAALTLSFTAVEMNEGSYWGSTMRIAQADAMAATGIMNTGGNVGGLIAIPIVAWLSGHQAWNSAFIIGFALSLVAALAWLGVDASRPLVMSPRAPPAGASPVA